MISNGFGLFARPSERRRSQHVFWKSKLKDITKEVRNTENVCLCVRGAETERRLLARRQIAL